MSNSFGWIWRPKLKPWKPSVPSGAFFSRLSDPAGLVQPSKVCPQPKTAKLAGADLGHWHHPATVLEDALETWELWGKHHRTTSWKYVSHLFRRYYTELPGFWPPDGVWWPSVSHLYKWLPHADVHHETGILPSMMNTYRRKFRSKTSDNMDRWKSRGGKSLKGEEQKREDQRRERVKRKKMQAREKVGKSRNTVFFHWFVAPEGRKAGSLKRRVRSHLARWEMKHISKSKV